MSEHDKYDPGPAAGADVKKDGERWTLVMTRHFRHAPDRVWAALTEPAQLREWAPYDADRPLTEGATVKLTTAGAGMASETTIKRAEAPRLLEFAWGPQELRWELEPSGTGTKLTVYHLIGQRFIAMGAAGWHVCFDVMDRWLAGEPMGRLVAGDALKNAGWNRLNEAYAKQFGVEAKLPF